MNATHATTDRRVDVSLDELQESIDRYFASRRSEILGAVQLGDSKVWAVRVARTSRVFLDSADEVGFERTTFEILSVERFQFRVLGDGLHSTPIVCSSLDVTNSDKESAILFGQMIHNGAEEVSWSIQDVV
jgi:hypothetical protein